MWGAISATDIMWGAPTAIMWGAPKRFYERNRDRRTACGGHLEGRHVGGIRPFPLGNRVAARLFRSAFLCLRSMRQPSCGGHSPKKCGRHVGGTSARFRRSLGVAAASSIKQKKMRPVSEVVATRHVRACCGSIDVAVVLRANEDGLIAICHPSHVSVHL